MRFASLFLALSLSMAPAAVLFQDNFDSSLASTTLNATIPQWTVSNGTIDYVKSGDFSVNCVGGTGGCLDLDGTSLDAGDLTLTTPLNLLGGTTYRLSFSLSGNQRGGAPDSMSVTFGLNVLALTNVAANSPFTSFFIDYTPLANESVAPVFSHAGGDNVGLVLDNVSVESLGVPEPGTMVLAGLALTALALRRRR